jgi:hypothetical protein
MALDSNIVGGVSGNKAEVDAFGHLKVIAETDVAANPSQVGGVKIFGENDGGAITGSPVLSSPEVDADYRQRVGQDLILDEEIFNYTAQNTGKHSLTTTTMTGSFTAGQFTTNASSITTTTTGAVLATYAFFPNTGTQTLSLDCEVAFSAQPQTNAFIEFGMGIAGAQTVAPTDGVFFRLTSAGLQGIASSNGTETSTGVFPLSGGTGTWVYVNDKKYQFIVYNNATNAQFWVDDGTGAVLLGSIPLPSAQGRMALAMGQQFFFKQRHTGGAAGGVIQGKLGAYNVRVGGSGASSTLSTQGLRMLGSYQGLSGGTMGSLASYANSANPTAAAPSNTAVTTNLPVGLGGQGAVIAAVAAATDGIWASYQVPAGTVLVQGRRLALRGVSIDAVNTGAAVATTATTIQFSLAYGHTAVSLATAEAATAKAPRRLALGYMTWPVAAAIGQAPQGGRLFVDLGDAPIFVNPGEFVQIVGKFLVGTATASQTISFVWQPIYGWE